MTVYFAGSFKQASGIGQSNAVGNADLHSRFAQDQRRYNPLVARTITVGDKSRFRIGRFIGLEKSGEHHTPCSGNDVLGDWRILLYQLLDR